MKSKLMILSTAGLVALAGFAARVVPVDRPGLVLPGKRRSGAAHAARPRLNKRKAGR